MLRHRLLSSTAVIFGVATFAATAPAGAECESDCLEPPDPSVLLTGGTTVSRATLGPVFSVTSSTVDQVFARTLNQSASGEILSDDGESKEILVQCSASSAPAGVATGIRECYLESKGRDHARYDAVDGDANPGPADASVSQVITVPTERYKVCILSVALYNDASFLEAPLVCS